MTSWTLEGLEERIKAQSDFIDTFISLIPPKPYFKNDPSKTEYENEQVQYNKKRVHLQLLQEQQKAAKKQKFDPVNLKTIPDIQRERLSEHKEKKKSDVDNVSVNADEIKLETDDSPRLTITDRLARLRVAKQKTDTDVEKISREERNRSKEERKKRKTKKQKEPKGDDRKVSLNEKSLENDDSEDQDPGEASGNMQFTKFDFGEKKKTKKIDNVHLMNKLQNRAEKIEKIKKEEPEKAIQLREKDEWTKALRKVQGEKIKDDPHLLKKTIKKNASKKKSSEKAWKERTREVEKKMEERQRERTKNIQERIDAKKNKKRGKKAR
ncbi:4960_t:CDS:2, partial [Acaulospora colombiana]